MKRAAPPPLPAIPTFYISYSILYLPLAFPMRSVSVKQREERQVGHNRRVVRKKVPKLPRDFFHLPFFAPIPKFCGAHPTNRTPETGLLAQVPSVNDRSHDRGLFQSKKSHLQIFNRNHR